MEFIVNNLKGNKVTLDIKPNKYQESYEYTPPKPKFDEIENIIDVYKSLNISKVSDKFIYCVLLYLDKTLSLVQDKNIFINKFKSDLKDKFVNYEDRLKKHGFDKESTFKAISSETDREALYYYVGYLLDKSIGFETDDDIDLYDIKKPNCLIINQSFESQEMSAEEALNKKYEKRVFYHIQHNTREKLNSLLVKDLKALAEEMGLSTTKIENGKKKNLLKGELKEIINLKICS